MTLPFAAVVGQDDLKLALLLTAVDPGIGGVLVRGQKGTAKSTVARGLASLLPGQARFVELPVGATEDRLVGTFDLAAALVGGDRRFEPGLLADANGGVLYIDEVNLLPDHLVDVLLDVAASGVNRVEREGVSHTHPSRFVLIGSMNPEEGDLRPQLLDRFGLAVEVVSPSSPGIRAEAVRRRLAFDADPSGFASMWEQAQAELRHRLASARPAALGDPLVEQVSRLCSSVGAEGLRADLTICRAAAALAGWEGRDVVSLDDVRRVAPLALAHRRRRSPFDAPGIDAEELDRALEAARDSAEAQADAPPDAPLERSERTAAPDEPTAVVPLAAASGPLTPVPSVGRRSTVEGPRGRLVGDRQPDGRRVESVALGATVRASVARRAAQDVAGPLDSGRAARGGPPVEPSDLREAVRQQRVGNLVVLAVDASGSMGADRRMEAAKGAAVSLLLDAYQRRDRVALITFRGDDAQVVLRPTGSVEVARARLAELPTGGRTPLAAGIRAALDLALAAGAAATHQPLLVFVTDGRATSGPDGLDPIVAAQNEADAVRRRGVSAVVVDAEDGPTRLGLASQLADVMGARYLTLPELSAQALRR
jgi:magnesium chelatase subunit D